MDAFSRPPARRQKPLPVSSLTVAPTVLRRALVMLMLVVGLALATLITGDAPAHAALHNPIPVNCADEEPTDVFVDADSLCAFMTSDFFGGRACVVDGSIVDPDAASCDAPAWGGKNVVLGIGTVFTLLKGPPLEPGTWRLLVENVDGGNGELSFPFTVVSCPECSREIGAAAAQRFKDAAASNQFGTTAGCAALNGKGAAARGLAQSLTSGTGGGGGGWQAFAVGFGMAFAIPDARTPGEEKAMELLKNLVCGLKQMYADIVADPPSNEYAFVPQPVFSTLSPVGVATADALAVKIDRLRAFGLAQLRAYERYQGALAAEEERFVHAQARAVADLGRKHIAELGEAADALRAFAAHLDTLPDFAGPVYTQEERDQHSVIYDRVRSTGLTTTERAALGSLGFSVAEIDAIQSHFGAAGPEDVPVGETLQTMLRQTADNLESQAEGYDEFATEAAVVAGRTNAPPVASFTALPSSGVAPLAVSFDDTSTSPDLDPIFAATWDFGDGTFGEGDSPSHTYTANGVYTVTLTVSDYLSSSSTQRTITVADANADPVAALDTVATATNTSGSVNVLANDSDPDGDPIAVTSWTQGAHGFVSCSFTGSCTYTPATDFVGSDSFTYTITDGKGGTATGTVDVTVSDEPPANRPPVAGDDVLVTGLNQPKTIDVLRNDTDPDSDPLIVTDWTNGDNGTVDCTGSGLCTYTPPVDLTGSEEFTYTISDGRGGTDVGAVAVTVEAEPANREPIAADDELVTIRNQSGTVDVVANDSDPDGDSVFILGWTSGAHGSVNCFGDDCTYFPGFNFTGTDTFTYSIHDGFGGTATGTVSVTVLDVNRSPVAVDDTLTTRREAQGFVNVLGNDSDPDLDPLTATVATPPEHGDLVCAEWGDCLYTPGAAFFGSDSFTYSVSDGRGGTDSATVAITVTPNRLPTPVDDILEVEHNVPASVNVLTNDSDPDGNPLTVFSVTQQPSNGTVDCAPGGSCTYTPNGDFTGNDQFQYTVSDGAETAGAWVHIRVRRFLAAVPDWVFRPGKSLSFSPAIDPPDAVGYECAWTFGDGGTSDQCAFEHTYAEVGTYDATIQVTFSNGAVRSDTAEMRIVAEEPGGGGGGGSTGRGEVVASTDRTYTLDDDFDAGTLLNVNHNAPNGNELRLNREATPFPFLYVAASARGTAVRIDIDTGEILGEYRTAPDFRASNPSRTTVDKLGNVWVTNRDEGSLVVVDGVETPMGSAARIGLLIGGTRVDADGTPNAAGGYVKPPFQYSTCVDRDGDGLIRTSNGLADILAWTNAADVDSDGGVETAADECLINYTRVLGTATRTVAIDSNNDAWIGGLDGWHEKVDGDTGQRVPGTAFNLGCGGYGGLIDGNDVLWSARSGNGLLRYDTRSGTGACLGWELGDYGLGIDPTTGHVWHTYFGDTVVKINPDGTEAGRFQHGYGAAQGVAVDSSGNVWVAHSLAGGTTVGHLRTDGTFVGNVDLRGGNGPTGVAVDSNGRVWSANINSNSASRIDPEIGPVGGGGVPVGIVDLTVDLGPFAGPYNYSDMTGAVSVGAASPSGFWSIVQDGGAAGTPWTKVSWNGLMPEGTEIEVEARAADTQVGLASEEFVVVTNGAALGLEGRFIEVRANLRTTLRDATPVLRDIRIASLTNEAPVAEDASVTTAEDTVKDLTLAAADPDGDVLTYTIASGPSHGTLTGSGASRTYTPDPNYHGSDSFTFRASDGALFDDAEVSFTVTPVNDAPVAGEDTAETDEDTPLPLAGALLRANDTDVDGDLLAVTAVSDPQHGSVVLVGQTAIFTPDPNYNGVASFVYTVSDGNGGSDTATVTVTVRPVNDAPRASELIVAGNEDVAIGVTFTGSDPENDPLTFAVATSPAHGTLSGTPPALTYTPDPDYHGGDSFTYTASDGALTSAPATVTITVLPVNDAPVATDGSVTTPEDTPVALPFAGTDVDGGTLTFAVVSGPEHGSVSDGTYTPEANYHGPDRVVFSVSDGLLSDEAAISITVSPVNDAPVAVDDAAGVDEDTVLELLDTVLLANDSDIEGDALTVTEVGSADHGSVVLVDGVVRYTPAAGFSGEDSFTYTIADGNGGSATARVVVTVRALNDGPSADELDVSTDEDTPVAVTLSGSDPEDDPLTFAVVSGPSHGTLSGEAPALTYTPNANYNGPDSFTYTASDGTAVSAAAAVAITVRPINDAPVATDAEVVTAEDTAAPLVFAGSDVDGDSLTFAVVSGPEQGALVDGTYVPAADYHGSDSVTFRVSDGVLFDDGTVAITVTPVNDAPVAAGDNAETARNTPVDLSSATLLANDTDVDGDTLTITEVGTAEQGTVALVEGVVTYTPEAGFTGADSFTYTVSDGNGGSDTATVSVDVEAVNRAPLASAASVETDEDVARAITLAGTDPDGDALTFEVVDGPAHGTLSGSAPALTYTPDANFNGSDSFSFRVSDGSLSDEALISITVDPVNDAPDAVDDTAAIDEDTVLELPALANDSDVDGDPLTIAGTGLAGHGLTGVADGKLVYTPTEHFFGEDSFTYTVSDGNGGSDTATVTVTVRPVSDAPDVADMDVATDEDTPVGVALSGSDPDGDLVLGFLVQILPAHGALSGVAPALTYTPDPNYHGPDSFTYAALDTVVPGLISVPATVTIDVQPVNDAPTAGDDTAATLRDTPLQLKSESLLANDADVDGDTLTLSEVGTAEHGTVALVDGVVTYTPAAGFTGADSFSYTVSDGNGGSDTAGVAVRVGAVNRAPLATAASVETEEDVALDITLAGTDPDGDVLTFEVVGAPTHGTLTGSAPALTYTPDANFNGSDSFSFRVSDGLLSDEATVEITANPVNDLPDAVDDAVATDEDTVLQISGAELGANDTDVDGDALTISAVGAAGHGTVELVEGFVVYTPTAGFSGEDAFTYTISDGNGGSDSATVAVTVRPANDGPSADDLHVATNEDTPVGVTLTGSDPEDDSLSFQVVSGPAHGTLSGTAPALTYTPDANYFGPDAFTYTASDGTAVSAAATVSITVRAINDAPQALDAAVTTAEDTPLALVLAGSDVDGDTLTVQILAGPEHGTYAAGLYTPATNYHGPDAITFRVSDGLLTDEGVVDITVAPVNDLPVADDQAVATNEDTALGITLSGSDADGDPLAFELVSGPSHGSLSGTGAPRTYTPTANYNGSDSFTFRVSDGQGGSDTAVVSITVVPINDPPVATNDSAATDEDTVLRIAVAQLLANDSDVDGDALTVLAVGAAGHGTVALVGTDVVYTPDAGYDGPDTFTYTVSDGHDGTATANVAITVRPFQPASFLLAIDADSIDNGSAPNFFTQAAVNDQLARVGLRTTLPAFAGGNVGRRLVLHTGQVGNEGWHALKTVPATWATAGPTTDGLRNYLLAGPGLGSGRNRERLLDNVRNVTPLRAAGLTQLVDQRVCAVVYDGDVSINYGPLTGSLKGDNLGVVAFKVSSVTQLLGYGSSALPKVEVEVLDRAAACGAPLATLSTAPAPISSSVPFDVVPPSP